VESEGHEEKCRAVIEGAIPLMNRSASLNFAIRYSGFDLDTNFSIYDLDMVAGIYREIRAGHLDQPGGM